MLYPHHVTSYYISFFYQFLRYSINLFLIFILGIALCHAQQQEIPGKAKEWMIKGDAQMEELNYEKAIKCYNKAVDKWNENSLLSLKIARCYSKLNDSENAEIWYSKAFASGEELDPIYSLYYGETLLKNKKYREARDWFIKYNQLIEENDLRASQYIKSIEDIDQYYSDSSFFHIKNVSINSSESDISPFLFGKKLFFVSDRGQKKNEKASTGYDIFYSAYHQDGSLEPPVKIPDERINSILNEGQLFISSENTMFVFTRYTTKLNKFLDTEKDIMEMHLFRVHEGDSVLDVWDVTPLNIENFTYSVGFPALNSYSNKMIFVSNDLSGVGKTDLYISYYINGSWSFPLNMGIRINTTGSEMFPYLYNDSILYFSSDGHGGLGGLDMFRVNLDQKPYRIENLGYPFNSSKDDFGISFEKNGLGGYFSSGRDGGKGSDDIYRFDVRKLKISGIFTDKETGENLKQIDLNITSDDSTTTLELVDNGSFEMDAPLNKEYEFEVIRHDYKPRRFSVSTDTKGFFDLQNISLGEIPLEKIEPTAPVAIDKPVSENLTSKVEKIQEPVKTEPKLPDKTELVKKEEPVVEEKEKEEISVEPEPQIVEVKDEKTIMNEIPDTDNPLETVFRVQIAASRVPLSTDDLKKIYSGDREIFMFREEGWYKYAIADFKSYFEANELRKTCGAKHVFIAAYQKEKKLVLNQAIQEKYSDPPKISDSSHNEYITDSSKILSHRTIYFDFDDFIIPKTEYHKLDEIVNQLKNNGSFILEIDAHADKQGSMAYNNGLSYQRAKETYNFFIQRGVDENQLIVRSYGESRLARKCDINCTPSIHRLNRRAELYLYNGDLNYGIR
jgi:outer membrane protein OmpA-like peptidoglycan-associated protein/tetratricopeptide (TPR) repeat protein